MIRIYSYYNHGGFKDFYFGTMDDTVECKYYIPLYNIYSSRLKENPTDKKSKDWENKLNVWNSLEQIKEINQNSENAYPSDASIVVSHSGYKLILKKLQNGSMLFSVRDIPGHSDEFDRPSPFNIMLLAETIEDKRSLIIIADYVRKNLNIFETFCAGIFEYDVMVNALKLNMSMLVSEFKQIIGTHAFDENLSASLRQVLLFVAPEGMLVKDAIKEQGLETSDIELLYNTQGKKFKTHMPPAPSTTILFNQESRERGGQHRMDIWEYARSLEKRIEELEQIVKQLSDKQI